MLPTNNIQPYPRPLIKPEELINKLQSTSEIIDFVQQARISTSNIIQGKDNRLLVVIGPCSIHDVRSAMEYAENLKKAAERFSDDLYIIMRVYFQKPRTTLGWKGLINDPFLDGTFDINQGIEIARKLLIQLNDRGVPAATEFVDPMIHHYLSDLISWSAMGARSVESQIHRELASGLMMPVGFKNNTDGNIKVAIDAVKVAKESHHYLGVSSAGIPAIIFTQGNDQCHIVLRGSNDMTNYSKVQVDQATAWLESMNLIPRVMIDCSHGNSMKDPNQQCDVIHDVASQITNGSKSICGVMLESHLISGKQELKQKNNLVYGQSVTDGCLGWSDSLDLLEVLAVAVHRRNHKIT